MAEIDTGVAVPKIVGVGEIVGELVFVGASHDADAGKNMLNRHEITPAANSTPSRDSPRRRRAFKKF
jgi:hypothetical protein